MIRVGESGKTLRVNAAYDLTSNSDVTLELRKPSGTVITKTRTAGQLTVGGSDSEEEVNGQPVTFLAGQYVDYVTESGVLDECGEWSARVIYSNTNETPAALYRSARTPFDVEPD